MRPLAVALALALALAPSAALAQEGPVTVRSEVDRAEMSIGDQALLTLTVDLAPGFRLDSVEVPRAVGDFEVVEALTALETRGPGGATRTRLRFLITSFEIGTRRIPQIGVGFRGPDGAPGTARTAQGHAVAVRSVIQPGEASNDIKPLKPPLPAPGTGPDLLRSAPLVAAAALMLAAAVLLLRARRRAPLPLDGPVLGPARAALAELERVLELGLPEKGRTREHYELVSAAVRSFVARRYGLAAEARTARELRRELEHSGVGGSAAQLLCEVLADAESVRYEERHVSPAQAKRSMRDLIELMRKSVVAEEYELISTGATA